MLITKKEDLIPYYPEKRIWQGIPSIEVTKNGRVFLTYYSGGTKEEFGNYCILASSKDGENFTDPIAVAYKEGYRCFDPCLWIDPLGRLWFTWAIAPEDAAYASICDDPDAEELTWCKPFFIGHDVMMNKPIALTSGEWLFPLAVWNYDVRTLAPEFDSLTHEKGSFAYKTSDLGKTFTKFGMADVPNRHFDEHMIVELKDGSLMMLVRTRYGIGVSYSYDRGATWTKGKDSGLGGPSSRFHITRLRSGRLLLINHKKFTKRNNLTAMLSDDDGKTWSEGILLDERNLVSYPDAAQGPDDYIYITYDRERGAYKKSLEEAQACAREILMAKISEEDILAGRIISKDGYMKKVASKLGEYTGEDRNPYSEDRKLSNSELAKKLLKMDTGEGILEVLLDIFPLPCYIPELEYIDQLMAGFMESNYDDSLLEQLIAALRAVSCPHDISPVAKAVKERIRESFCDDISVSSLSEEFGISRYYLCHLFKKEYGVTILDYRNCLRMTLAKQLLISTDDKIGDIAQKCGFGSSSRFGDSFQQQEKMTPNEYRKLHK